MHKLLPVSATGLLHTVLQNGLHNVFHFLYRRSQQEQPCRTDCGMFSTFSTTFSTGMTLQRGLQDVFLVFYHRSQLEQPGRSSNFSNDENLQLTIASCPDSKITCCISSWQKLIFKALTAVPWWKKRAGGGWWMRSIEEEQGMLRLNVRVVSGLLEGTAPGPWLSEWLGLSSPYYPCYRTTAICCKSCPEKPPGIVSVCIHLS